MNCLSDVNALSALLLIGVLVVILTARAREEMSRRRRRDSKPVEPYLGEIIGALQADASSR